MQKKKWLGAVIGFVVLAVVIAAVAVIYVQSRPEPDVGDKTVTVKIVYDDQEFVRTIDTDAAYLRGAVDDFVKGDETQLGLLIKEVNGRKADDAKQEWWCITKGGEKLATGVDTTPIADGDTFEITLMVGYDLF